VDPATAIALPPPARHLAVGTYRDWAQRWCLRKSLPRRWSAGIVPIKPLKPVADIADQCFRRVVARIPRALPKESISPLAKDDTR
jgi:hypothetical protein